MSSTDNVARLGVCTNSPGCTQAAAGAAVEWYGGAGEYCPECGEALTVTAPGVTDAPRSTPPIPTTSRIPPEFSAPRVIVRRRARLMTPLRWFWIVVVAGIASAGAGYAARYVAPVSRVVPSGALALCVTPSAQQLASDLVRGFAAKHTAAAERFVISDGPTCDARFTTASGTPDAAIARDGIVVIVNPLNPIARINESQLRAIFAGAIRDWSELGGEPQPIVALLPDAGTDEFKALTSSLFYGVTIDRSVRRAGSSARVTRAVTGANRAGRGAIGLVAFSQAVTAKVVPLAYLPAPSVLTIASRRYPFTLSIALISASQRNPAATANLIGYARSSEGAEIVEKNGLVPPEGR